jgi:hypothetical protein
MSQKKKIGLVSFSLAKMAICEMYGKGLEFKKVGIAKSSCVCKSNNKSET